MDGSLPSCYCCLETVSTWSDARSLEVCARFEDTLVHDGLVRFTNWTLSAGEATIQRLTNWNKNNREYSTSKEIDACSFLVVFEYSQLDEQTEEHVGR